MKEVLTERKEIAFYNVIDHRCDKMEKMNVPVQTICKKITEYTENYIAKFDMSIQKQKELRLFTKQILRIISNPIGWLSK